MAASRPNRGKFPDVEETSLMNRPTQRQRRERLLKDLQVPGWVVVSPSGPDISSQLGGRVSLAVGANGEWLVEEQTTRHRTRRKR